ncbi:MAG: MATE family efflux transporter [Bacteroidales bacterium]|nr:MATE family efflux transporter [Bacteroidales bacterium]
MSGKAPTELGTLSIGKLLKMYAVPGIIAQTAASLYNMVDSIYIGHIPGVGSAAISGLAVTFPLMNLSIAFGTLVGVGSMTLISVLLGQRNYEDARKVLSNVFALNVIVGALFAVGMLFFLDPVLRFFGASDVTIPFARDYMFIILLGNVITHLYYGFNGVIRAAGNPRTAMGLTLFTVVSNAILDPVFIFAFGLGIKGAAIATILCQILALTYSFRFLSDKESYLHFSKPVFKIDLGITKKALAIGLGPFMMNLAACLVAVFVNQQLKKYGGDMAIGAYGIINRFTMLFAMICMGFNQGLQPIAGYNYGARLYKRVKRVFVLTAQCELIVTTVLFLLSELCPEFAVRLFTNDNDLVAIATHGMRLAGLSAAVVGFGMASSNFFQSVGMVKKSIFLSLTRQLLFLLPVLYVLPRFIGQDGVWLSFPISDALNFLVALIMVVPLMKKLDSLEDGSDASILGGSL